MEEDDWHSNNIFKMCRLVMDSGRCKIVVSKEAVQTLKLKTEKHPSPYCLC
jgi:hypothetical protein